MSRSAHQKKNADRNNNTMTDANNTADILKDGDDEFDSFAHNREETEKDNSTSSPDETNHDGDTHSPDGDDDKNNQDDPDKDKPFHEHPRWKEREEEHKKRFNDMEARHQEDMRKLREEFSEKRKENADNTEIPSWFGGTKEQWDAYRQHEDQRIKEAEERAISRLKSEEEEKQKAKESEETKVKEATEYMKTELEVISTDKTVNPDSLKVDPNKLVQYTIDNMLIDAQGRWDYRKAFRYMKAEGLIKPTTTASKDRKELADATNDKESKGEPNNTPGVKTSKDFKMNKPW